MKRLKPLTPHVPEMQSTVLSLLQYQMNQREESNVVYKALCVILLMWLQDKHHESYKCKKYILNEMHSYTLKNQFLIIKIFFLSLAKIKIAFKI